MMHDRHMIVARRGVARRGVAMVMAIALIGLVAVILAAVATRSQMEFRRTVTGAEEAQASQLLIAGAEVARVQFASGTRTDGVVPTPIGEVTLTWRDDGGAGFTCMIDAKLPHLARSTELKLSASR